jgi:hypothetical protein
MATLRQLVTRQLVVMTYVDERLGPRVFIDTEDIRTYYDRTLVPEMRRRNQTAPPLDDVREEIRTVLREQRLNDEIRRWTAELREDADVAVYLDTPQGSLPPVVKTLDGGSGKKGHGSFSACSCTLSHAEGCAHEQQANSHHFGSERYPRQRGGVCPEEEGPSLRMPLYTGRPHPARPVSTNGPGR